MGSYEDVNLWRMEWDSQSETAINQFSFSTYFFSRKILFHFNFGEFKFFISVRSLKELLWVKIIDKLSYQINL